MSTRLGKENSMLNKIVERYSCTDISYDKITKGRWFIGSALQAVDYQNLSEGYYYYKQPTIWTRMLDVDPVNPYWEIHNETENFLLVNKSNEEAVDILQDILFHIIPEGVQLYSFGKGELNFSSDMIREFQLEIPFHINGERVGNYRKIFVNIEDRFYPVIDCTEFQSNQRWYFEINLNMSYLEMVCKQLDCVFYGKRYINIVTALGIKEDELIFDQRNIRLVSLIETIQFLERYKLSVTASYLGHTIKKIFKLLALQLFLLGLDSDILKNILSEETIEIVKKELLKLQNIKIDFLKKYDTFTLSDRYGITKEIQEAVLGKKNYLRNYNKDTVKYFTDIPFCKDISSEYEFIKIINKIQKGK